MNQPKKGSLQAKVLAVLQDTKWHCRLHEHKGIPSAQLAGGGGIQGLQRGTRARPGLIIESKTDYCDQCKRKTRWDRWTGRTQKANPPASISTKLCNRIRACYKNTDVIEQRERPSHELTVDHRFPMNRWGAAEEKLPNDLSEIEIQRKFQLLKKDSSGFHNLLKSRACENCVKTGKRGKPFGIKFFYHGDEEWPKNIPPVGVEAEKGCVGCGWYDFAKWREALNLKLSAPKAAS